MTEAIKVLLVEDAIEDAELLIREMRKGGLEIDPLRVDTDAGLAHSLHHFDPDVILCDYSVPGVSGISALAMVQQQRPDIPFIFVSGTIGEERAIEALKQGAVDYVLKDNRARLLPAIERALKETEARQALHRAEQELADSEERFRSIADAIVEWIWEIDVNGSFTYCSHASSTILGYAPEELIGTNANNYMLEEDGKSAGNLAQSAFANRHGWRNLTFRWKHKNGSTCWLESNAVPLHGSDGELVGYRGADRDITDRAWQQEKNERLNRFHAMQSGINSAITRIRERNALLREACRIAVEKGGIKLAWSGFVDMESHALTPVNWVGEDAEILSGFHLTVRDNKVETGSIVNKTIDLSKPVVGNLLDSDMLHPQRAEMLLQRGVRSIAVLPMVIGGRVVGVLALYSSQSNAFDCEEEALLQELADDLSFALDYLEKETALNYLALYDVLTELPNRKLFFERTAQSIQACEQTRGRLALVVLDIRRFDLLNDTFGKAKSDQVLKLLAKRLSTDERINCARIGGNTFAMALSDLHSDADVAHALKKYVFDTLARPFSVENQEISVTARCGVALYPADGAHVDELLGNAEAALKRAKLSGAEYIFYTESLNARIAQQLVLESQLRLAIVDKQFILHYQPKIAADDGRLVGLDALIRWNSPKHGLLPAREFITILEQTGMIAEVDKWVLQKAASDYRDWYRQGFNPPSIAVNISADQLRHPDFLKTVCDAVAGRDGEEPAAIHLEIAESALAENVDSIIPSLLILKDKGIGIAIDNFGTGHSSLSYLAKIPLNAIKIDSAFIADLTTHTGQITIASTIILLAHALKLKVIAKGVGTIEQRTQLQFMGCDELQGYLLGKPMTGTEVETLLSSLSRARGTGHERPNER
ncbi:EAL domain-containing protein [Collimonas silvisoli]|uniref:EAL domain-containing protein n=1 Tax=Collimonas silvisoli TaxID=2825884 RepID=UPI001B8DA464|nr:EAL domain-containing protein [Collimonas silvisoli]